jgi:hypothetical protein
VQSCSDESTLHTGDTARYPADLAHEIRAIGGAARAILIVQDS